MRSSSATTASGIAPARAGAARYASGGERYGEAEGERKGGCEWRGDFEKS